MISRRIIVNVVVFVVLGAILTFWVISTYIEVGFASRDVEVVYAEFEESPGLRADYQVSYLGHDVGLIGPITLETGKVTVEMHLNVGEDLPQAVTAAVRRRSAVGEPYINLEPKEGTDPHGGPRLSAGDVIPVEDTSVPLSYEEVFSAVDNLLSAVDPEATGTLVRELAAGVEGTSQTFRKLLIDVEDITSSFSEERDTLEGLTDELTALTSTIAGRAGAIGTSIDSVDLLAATLLDSRDELLRLTQETPPLVNSIADLFAESRSDLTCAIQVLATVGLELGDEESAALLDDVFQDTTRIIEILDDVESHQPDGTWLRVKFHFNDPSGTPSVQYQEPIPFPVIPGPQVCDFPISQTAGPYDIEGAPGTGLGELVPGVAPDGPVRPDERDPSEAPDELASSETPFAPSVINPLLALPVLALVVLLAVWRPWRLLGAGRRTND